MSTEIPTHLFYNRSVFKEIDLTKPAYEYWNIEKTDIPPNVGDLQDAKNNFVDEYTSNQFRDMYGYETVYDAVKLLIYDELANVYDNDSSDLVAYGDSSNIIPFIFGTNSLGVTPLQDILKDAEAPCINLDPLSDNTIPILNGIISLIAINPDMCKYGSDLDAPLYPRNPMRAPPTTLDRSGMLQTVSHTLSVGKSLNPRYVLGKLRNLMSATRRENEYFMFIWDIDSHIFSGFMYFEYIHPETIMNIKPIHQDFTHFFHITAFCGNIPHNAKGASLMPVLLMKVCSHNPIYQGIVLDSLSILSTITFYNSIGFNIITDEHNRAVKESSEVLMVWCKNNPKYVPQTSTSSIDVSITRITRDALNTIRDNYNSRNNHVAISPEIENAAPNEILSIITQGFPDYKYSYIRTSPLVMEDPSDKLKVYYDYLDFASHYDITHPILKDVSTKYVQHHTRRLPPLNSGAEWGGSYNSKNTYRELFDTMNSISSDITKKSKVLTFALNSRIPNPSQSKQIKTRKLIIDKSLAFALHMKKHNNKNKRKSKHIIKYRPIKYSRKYKIPLHN
jgi:hypothetical protein